MLGSKVAQGHLGVTRYCARDEDNSQGGYLHLNAFKAFAQAATAARFSSDRQRPSRAARRSEKPSVFERLRRALGQLQVGTGRN